MAKLSDFVIAFIIVLATATVLIGANATAGAYVNFRLTGTVSVNAAGTFIPQYILFCIERSR